MTTEPSTTEQNHEKPKIHIQNYGSDNVYAIGATGAWVYFFKQVATTQERIKANFRGLV